MIIDQFNWHAIIYNFLNQILIFLIFTVISISNKIWNTCSISILAGYIHKWYIIQPISTNSICDKYTLDSSTKIIHHPGNINTMIHGVNPYQNTENVSIFFSEKSRKSSSNFVTDILNQYITLCHSLLEINSTIYLV